MLNRRDVIATLLRERPDLLVVSGLGSPTWDVAAAGDSDENFYLWGAMGGAVMVGLGLALAQPKRKVLVVTGDGEMLMGLGSLATVAHRNPPNLAIAVLDNGHYGETGMQPSHTAGRARLQNVATACGIALVHDVEDGEQLQEFRAAMHERRGPLFARIRIESRDEPRVLPERDGVTLKSRFRRSLGLEEVSVLDH
ncbi:MAG: thiamine pyrophosphate-dependent enzyme [Gemmatimonadota bacterium]